MSQPPWLLQKLLRSKFACAAISPRQQQLTAGFVNPVRSKYSCGASVVLQQTTKTLCALDIPAGGNSRWSAREQEQIFSALVITLGMIVFNEFAESSPEGSGQRNDAQIEPDQFL
jgi:hypothetical protein